MSTSLGAASGGGDDCFPSDHEPCATLSRSVPVSNSSAPLSYKRLEPTAEAGVTDFIFPGSVAEEGTSSKCAPASPLCTIPAEILENIALEVVVATPLGPPSALMPILCTCKRTNEILCFEKNRSLYARIFNCKFDTSAIRRRLAPRSVPSRSLAGQLRLYINALQDIRKGDIYSPHVNTTLWTAFLMMLENDGKNRAQLEWAGLDSFLDKYITNRLDEGREQCRGWLAENEGNSLALWLMTMTITEEKLLLIDEIRRDESNHHLLPYILLACRYPVAYAPENHFHLPLKEQLQSHPARSVHTAHGSYPPYRDPESTVYTRIHFGLKLKLSIPLISTAAKILYFGTLQLRRFEHPGLPANRAQAIQLGGNLIRPTQEDLDELNAFKVVKFSPTTQWDWWVELTPKQTQEENEGIWHRNLKPDSVRHDFDWQRLTRCWNPWGGPLAKSPPYTIGSLDGLWHGRMLVPAHNNYTDLVGAADFPSDFCQHTAHSAMVPVYMRLHEHHSVSPQIPASTGGKNDGFDDGLFNAYFRLMHCQESDGCVNVTDIAGNKSYYETYSPDHPNSHDVDTCRMCARAEKEREMRMKLRSPNYDVESMFESMGLGSDSDGDDDCFSDDPKNDAASRACDGIQDIIVTGRTDARHGQAWNYYKYYGRVRRWDGLIAILRVPDHPDSFVGRWVFTGYLIGEQNLVGSWRIVIDDVGLPSWGGPFVLSRRDD